MLMWQMKAMRHHDFYYIAPILAIKMYLLLSTMPQKGLVWVKLRVLIVQSRENRYRVSELIKRVRVNFVPSLLFHFPLLRLKAGLALVQIVTSTQDIT